jgi:uncharacterized protein (UPF0303 family)
MLGQREQNPAAPGFELPELIEQEERFVFDHFTQSDALRLGRIMLDICEEYDVSFGCEIYLNGMTVFKSMPEGTGRMNDAWMKRKIDTVLLTGWSTMRLWAFHEMIGSKRAASIVPVSEYVTCGGGFPVKVRGAGIIGAIACSGPGDQIDHEFCIEALERYFKG